MVRTHYDNLQVSQKASDEVIKGAFKFLSQKWHPDKQPPEMRAEAEHNMKIINEAYQILINPVSRKEHDEWIKAQEADQAASHQSEFDPESEQNPSGENNNKLSLDRRLQLIQSIARREWGVALIKGYIASIFWFVIIFVIYALYKGSSETATQFLDSHQLAMLTVQLFFTIVIGKAYVDEKKQQLLDINNDNDLLDIHLKPAFLKQILSVAVWLLIASIIGGTIFGKSEDVKPNHETLADAKPLQSPKPIEKQSEVTPPKNETRQESSLPKFSDYPAVVEYAGKPAALVLDNQWAVDYQSRLSEALLQKPEFAGEYVLATWGCGTLCTHTSLVNKRTGKLLDQSFGGETGPYLVKYKLDSNLLIAQGPVIDNEQNEIGNEAYYYELVDGDLKLIRTISIKKSS